MPKKLEYLLVALFLGVAIVLRLYHVTYPLADWHSWRQADTAAVSRNFVQDRFNLLYPQSDSFWALSEHQLPNPNRYFMNEFPFYNALVATIYTQTGINPMYGRLVSIVFAVTGAFFLYLLVKRLLGAPTALLTLLLYAVNPYNVYYGRVFMPDPTFVSLSIISLYWCVRWVESAKLKHGLVMTLILALAILVKPYAIFILIPIIYWLYLNRGLKYLKTRSVYTPLLLSLFPFLLWRLHLFLHPEGSFASLWLLNGDHIRFTGAFFRWIIFERLNRLIFATGGFVLFVLGLFVSHLKKKSSFFFVWTLAIFLYICVFAKGNVQHDYYQLPLLAPGSVMIAIGSIFLIKLGKTKLQKIINSLMVTALLVLSLAFGWYEVRGFFNINNPAIVEAGQAADQLLPKDAIVIAPYQGDPAFLYQTNRHGWPVGGNLDERIKDGANYYITTSRDDEYIALIEKYPIIKETDQYSIIKLSQ